MAHNKTPAIKPYTGLSEQFRTTCINLCRHQLPSASWRRWHELPLPGTADPVKKFATLTAPDDKLAFLDHYLYRLLLPKNIAAPNRNMLPRWSPDLNGYRGWLLHRVLLHMNEEAQQKRGPQGEMNQNEIEQLAAAPNEIHQDRFQLPEDLPKIVEDLNLFHTHIDKRTTNISSCKSLQALSLLVTSHRPKYPLHAEERAIAYAQFLHTDTPMELEKLLPPGWQVTETQVTIPDGHKIERLVGARLVGTLKNGTDVIQLLIEPASIAFGSPRWCTAQRAGRNYFHTYAEDLLVVLAADGQRWQIHFPTAQWRDGTDHMVKFADLRKQQPGLAELLHPYLKNYLENTKRRGQPY